MLRHVKYGEQVYEKELIEAEISGRRRDCDAHVEENADKGDVHGVDIDIQGLKNEIERCGHTEPGNKGDRDEDKQIQGGAYTLQIFLDLDKPLSEFGKGRPFYR